MKTVRARRLSRAVLAPMFLVVLSVPSVAIGSEEACPATSGATGPIELCGTNTIETSTTGRARVRVATDATVDLNPAPEIVGDGRIVGFLLTEPGTTKGFWVRVLRYPDILDWGVQTRADGQRADDDREPSSGPTDIGDGWSCSVCHVPAGEYDLYVIADGAPVSITLELQGLDGERALTAEDLMPAYSRQIDGFHRAGTGDTLYRTTSRRTFCCAETTTGMQTFIQLATRAASDTVAVASHRVCFRVSGGTGCDGGSSRHEIVGASTAERQLGWHTAELGPGRYELSSSFEAINTAGSISWAVDVVGLALGIAPADAVRAPRVFDIGGDANGLGTGGVHRDTRPVSWDPADLLLVRMETTYERTEVGNGIDYEPTGIAIRFKTLTSPDTFVQDAGIHFRLVTSIAGCPSHLLGTVYRDPDTGEPTTNAYWDQHDEACPDGAMSSYSENRDPAWTATIDPERRELRLFYPFDSLSPEQAEFMRVGHALTAPRAETHSPFTSLGTDDTRADASNLLDATVAADDFVIGSDVPADVPCTSGC